MQPKDPSLRPDPDLKGSYYRRIEDIGRALDRLAPGKLPKPIQFAIYYFASDKLARGIVGISHQWPADEAYAPGNREAGELEKIKNAAMHIELSISNGDLNDIFADHTQQHLVSKHNIQYSARELRNKITHDFGPSNIDLISGHADFLVPKMRAFLACVDEVLAYQKRTFGNIR